MDRWASKLTGPDGTPARADGQTRPRALTAAGARINLRSPDLVHTKHPSWQDTAWDYRDEVPELRFAGDFITNALGRLRVYPAENRPRGQEPVPLADATVPGEITKAPGITAATREAAKAALDRLDLDRHGSSLLARMGENLEFAGECYLLGEPGDEGERWTIRSVSEVHITQGGARLVEPGSGPVASKELRADQCELLRLWNPHPRHYDWPDSAMASLLTTLEGMVVLGRRGRAHDRSRISSGKAFYLPWEFSLTRPGDSSDVDEDDDPALAAIAEAFMAPIRDESDPSSVVPVVIRGPAMLGDRPAADVLTTIDLHGEDPSGLDDRYEALVQRLARGISLPPEVIKGIGDTNHWNGQVIDATMVKNHIEPRAERMVDALTAAYFRPALKAMGVPAEQRARVCLWFDASELVQNPNRDAAAKDAHTAGVISDAALRETLGFTDEHKPDNLEMLRRAVDRERLSPASVPILTKILGGRMPTDQDISQILGEFTQSGQPRIIDAGPAPSRPGLPDTPGGARTAPVGGDAPGATTAAAGRKPKGPRDDPDGPSVAGLALMAADTGRVLMLQRAVGDDTDPAAGTWEFPGGHIEDGDETSLHGAMREWSEEVGQPVPPGGAVVHTWTSPDGVYQGHVVVIAEEAALDLAAKRTVSNPDDDAEQCAWWDPEHARKNPALRRECRRTPWSALKRAARTVRSPVTAAAVSSGRYRVDEAASRRLAQIDRALTDRLVAHADATIARAVERAANRIRGRAQKNPTLAAAFPPGCDPVAVVAATGRDTAGDLTDDQLLAGALDEFATRWEAETSHAAEQAATVVAAMVGKAAADGLLARLLDGARRAWEWLRARLQRHVTTVLYGESDADPAPTALIRGALTIAGGVPETSPGVDDTGAPVTAPGQPAAPHAGVATGQTTSAAIRDGGAQPLGWIWGYHGGARQDPFLPHRALDGHRFAGFDDPALTPPASATFVGPRMYPGDHRGCLCSIETIWATPTGGEDRSSSENRDLAAVDETPAMRQIRELAEADDAAGRVDTTAQRDRDAAAEIAELRRQHITARRSS